MKINARYYWIFCFIVAVFILMNFALLSAVNKFDSRMPQIIAYPQNVEDMTQIPNSNTTNLGSGEAQLIPSLLISVDNNSYFRNELLNDMTKNGFDLIANETKKYGSNEYLLIQVNNTETVLKLKDYLNNSYTNLTLSVLRESEQF